MALLIFVVTLNAQQDISPIKDDGNPQIELATEDSTNANPIVQQEDQTAVEDKSHCIAIIAKLTAEREDKDAAISSLELVKQKQMALIINLQEKEDKEAATGIANLESQLLNQTGLNANLQSAITNLTAEQDKINIIIANLQSQLVNQTAINANRTGGQEKKKIHI